ncbi:hypothetical protein VP01_4512g1 [Puccinia sorghi]|uniref:Uncharacterized protein n=1 Tax=Puccinia sorghi TaxID=27349 RepID=A0A0L6UPV0_9BASI|nr:hypothetical protein VP01_4512g1 [Puccinia sorghi]
MELRSFWDTQSPTGTNVTPANNKKKSNSKRLLISLSSSSPMKRIPRKKMTSKAAPKSVQSTTKRIQERKVSVVKKSIDGSIGAITKEVVIGNMEIGTQCNFSLDTASARELELLAEIFLEKVKDKLYIQFVFLLEDKIKASTFLSLVKTSLKKICQMWLNKEELNHQCTQFPTSPSHLCNPTSNFVPHVMSCYENKKMKTSRVSLISHFLEVVSVSIGLPISNSYK